MQSFGRENPQEAEKRIVESRYEGARIIEHQLEVRKKERQREAEMQRAENELMLKVLQL